MTLLVGLLAAATAFTAPLSRAGLSAVRMSEEPPPAAAEPTPMAPSFANTLSDKKVSEEYAVAYKQMGKIGAYMMVRETMAQAYNAAAADDGSVTQEQLATVLSSMGEDPDGAESQFAAAVQGGKDKIIFEAWVKAFLDASVPKPEEGEKKFFGLF